MPTVPDFSNNRGGIPLGRIRMTPLPGTAPKQDVIEADLRSDRACELIDGVLVENPPGIRESIIAALIGHRVQAFLETRDLGFVLGANGPLEILPGQVRIPDVCLVSWDRFPNRKLPEEPILPSAPDLAIEVLSDGNTEQEMRRKLHDYFTAGVRLVWYIDPRTRLAKSYTAVEQFVEVSENGALSGGDVLPGFDLPLHELFAKV